MPVSETPLTVSAVFAVFVRVVVCGALVWCLGTWPKSMLFGTISTLPIERVIDVLVDLVVSVVEVAVSVTVGLVGTVGGAA